jgi:hypothetical protein
MAEAMRAKLLKARVDPRWVLSSSDKVNTEPNRANPKTDTDEPRRAYVRTAKEDPRCRKSKTESEEGIRMKLLSDNEEPR